MFVFDDILLIDDRSIQQILREVDQKDLILALKGASEEVKAKILKNMSTRARALILEEMEVMGTNALEEHGRSSAEDCEYNSPAGRNGRNRRGTWRRGGSLCLS